MRNAILISSASIAAALIGVMALTFSPDGCGCTDPWEDYVYYAHLSTGTSGVKAINAKMLQAGLWANLKNKKLEPGRSVLGDKYGCKQTTSSIVNCHSVLETSPLLNRGFDIEYKLNPDRSLRSVRARRFIELHPNNSFKPKPLRGSA